LWEKKIKGVNMRFINNWGFLVLSIYLILVGITFLVTGVTIPPVILGVLALVSGVLILIGR
jgi:hypothetical protein